MLDRHAGALGPQQISQASDGQRDHPTLASELRDDRLNKQQPHTVLRKGRSLITSKLATISPRLPATSTKFAPLAAIRRAWVVKPS